MIDTLLNFIAWSVVVLASASLVGTVLYYFVSYIGLPAACGSTAIALLLGWSATRVFGGAS